MYCRKLCCSLIADIVSPLASAPRSPKRPLPPPSLPRTHPPFLRSSWRQPIPSLSSWKLSSSPFASHPHLPVAAPRFRACVSSRPSTCPDPIQRANGSGKWLILCTRTRTSTSSCLSIAYIYNYYVVLTAVVSCLPVCRYSPERKT